MYAVQQVSASPLQKQVLVLPDGTSVSLTMYFIPIQTGWFITELVYGTFILRGLRITNSPNMLNQFRNQIPFGLACITSGNREPTQQLDFFSGASKLYILSEDETTEFAEILKLG